MFKQILNDLHVQIWEFFSHNDKQVSGVLIFFSAFYKTFLFGMVIADVGVIVGITGALMSIAAKGQEIYYKYVEFKKKRSKRKTKDDEQI